MEQGIGSNRTASAALPSCGDVPTPVGVHLASRKLPPSWLGAGARCFFLSKLVVAERQLPAIQCDRGVLGYIPTTEHLEVPIVFSTDTSPSSWFLQSFALSLILAATAATPSSSGNASRTRAHGDRLRPRPPPRGAPCSSSRAQARAPDLAVAERDDGRAGSQAAVRVGSAWPGWPVAAAATPLARSVSPSSA